MIFPPFSILQGKLGSLKLDSHLLNGNFLGDPPQRDIHYYLPPVGPEEKKAGWPLFLFLPAFWGTGRKAFNWEPFVENLPTRMERLFIQKKLGPFVLVMPDFFTRLGGNQYVDSSTVGAYSSAMVREMIPLIEKSLPVSCDPKKRVLFGTSSGGFGALHNALEFPGEFGALLCSSGDMNFETLLKKELPSIGDFLFRQGGSLEGYFQKLENKKDLGGEDIHFLFHCLCSASFAPDPSQKMGFSLPVDLFTGEVKSEIFNSYLKFDPLVRVQSIEDCSGLKSLKGLFLECGDQDEYLLHQGARLLNRAMKKKGISHHFEEFPGGHRGTHFRFDKTLPWLYETVST